MAAEAFADGLMAEADAEDRHFAAEFADDVLGDAGVTRDAGAWREDDGLIVFLADLNN